MPAVTRSQRKNKGKISLIKTKYPSKNKMINHTNLLTSISKNKVTNRKKNKQNTHNVSIYESIAFTCIMGVCSYPTIILLRFFLLNL